MFMPNIGRGLIDRCLMWARARPWLNTSFFCALFKKRKGLF